MLFVARWCTAFVVAFATLGAACSQSAQDPANSQNDLRQTRVPGEYLVTVVAGADAKAIAEVYGRFGIKATQDLGNDLFLVKLAEDPGLPKLEELRGQSLKIKAVQPNFIYRSSGSGSFR